MRMKKINKNKIESYIESSFENGIINLRKLKKCLIDDTNCVKRSQRTIIDKGILLKIDYKK